MLYCPSYAMCGIGTPFGALRSLSLRSKAHVLFSGWIGSYVTVKVSVANVVLPLNVGELKAPIASQYTPATSSVSFASTMCDPLQGIIEVALVRFSRSVSQ